MRLDVCEKYIRMNIPLGREAPALGKLQNITYDPRGNSLDIIFSKTVFTEINSSARSIECQPRKCERNSEPYAKNTPTTDPYLR
jgi:hypothetical protein